MINSLVKPVNLFLAGYSYVKSSATGQAFVYGMPLAIGAELTNHCNLHCPECSSGSGEMRRKRGFMDIGLFRRIISEIGPYLYNINLYFQGESLMHPLFSSFIRESRKIKTVLSTNGHFLSVENSRKIAGSGLTKLIISLDGIDQETYSAYRTGGNLKTVMDGIMNIADAKRKYNSRLKIEIQLLVSKVNEKQIPQIRKLVEGLNLKLRLKSMQIISKGNFEYWLPDNSRYSRYRIMDGEFRIKSSMPARCARLWFNPVVTWDGKVLPCCFDKDADHIMGDLNHESFREIWNGTRYRMFRRILLEERSTIVICRNCTSGLRGVIY
jgi:radical SAM protein with 4Fe4S-binding SPASM domain